MTVLFRCNNASTDGGAIYNNQGTLTVNNSTFTNNNANEYCGCIYTENGISNIMDCTFSNNTAGVADGAIGGDGTVTIKDSTFTNNHADNNGGAVGNGYTSGTLILENNTFIGNTAPFGGAVGTWWGGILNATGNTFSR